MAKRISLIPCKGRRGLIFSLDATLALLLLFSLSTVVLLFTFTSNTPQTVQENFHLKASDSIGVLSQVSVQDVRREPPVALLFSSGVVGPGVLNESIVQLVADLWASGDSQNLSLAQNLTDYFLGKFFSSNANFAVFASNQSISNRTPSGQYSIASASRSFVSGISSNRSIALGCVARAFVQKIRGKQETAITYFGGYEGQGNLTAVVRNVPSSANVSEVYVEANSGLNFTLTANGVDCGLQTVSGGLYDVNSWTFNSTQGAACMNAVVPGLDNYFYINFTGSNLTQKYFGGGLVKVTYNTSDLVPTQNGTMRYYFNGVDGVVNYYSSFYVPGNVTQITGSLHLFNNYSTFLTVGNKTVYQDNGTNVTRTIPIGNSNFSGAFPNYAEVSLKTVPLRLGVTANLTGQIGNADVVLITDVSGSMDWRMDQDNIAGTIRGCGDPLLYDPSTQRLSVAKCIDENFIQTILGGVGNQIAIVSFSDMVENYTGLSNNTAYLNNTIDGYAIVGGTCVACAINKAYDILKQYSGVNRTRNVIIMTDGVANYRATGWCALDEAESKSNLEYIPGDSGGFIHYNPYNASNWTDYSYGGANAIYGVAPVNASFAYAAGQGGLYTWNGSEWELTQSLGTTFYGIDALNASFGFAAGTSGKIYQTNGVSSWAQNNDLGSQTFRSVSILNATNVLVVGYSGSTGYLEKYNGGTSWSANTTSAAVFYDVKYVNSSWAFAVGSNGNITRWDGKRWNLYQDTGSQTWYDLSVVNSSRVYVAGSGGAIYRWTGSSFASFPSPTSSTITGMVFYNDSLGKIVTNTGLIYVYNGTTASWSLSRDARSTGTLSTGSYCSDNDVCSASYSTNYAAVNANWSSCRVHQDLNSTNYAVGFGTAASCALANTTLTAVAQCGNGTYFGSNNATALSNFYTSLAKAIVQQSNTSQSVTITGGVQTTLLPDSYLEFTYNPQYSAPYQSISIQRTARFSSCQGSVYGPANFSIYDFKLTSYSADRWTSNVSVNNALGLKSAFNLSVYNQSSYLQVGDPFFVALNPALLVRGGNNTFDVRTAFSPLNQSSQCSANNTAFYSGWVNASVGYGNFFPYCFARNVTVYYDLNGDNKPDGSVDVLIGGNANETAIPASMLNQNGTNAIEDAFQRLLLQLDLNTTGGASGSQQNPVDVALSQDVASNFIANSGLPALNSTDFSVVVWH